MSTTKLHGISNCDTVRKVKKWLDAHSAEYTYVDFRKDGICKADVTRWVSKAGLDKVLNKRGTTWRKLADEKREFASEQQAIELLVLEPTLIKRPILETGERVEVGFDETIYKSIFE